MATANNDSLLEFLQQASARTSFSNADLTRPTPQEEEPEEPQNTQLTEEENNELVQQALRNLGLVRQEEPAVQHVPTTNHRVHVSYIPVAQEEPVPQTEEVLEQIQPNPFENIPPMERPVQIPDYVNVKEETQRFSGADWFKKVQEKVIILAGVGGIGSNMAIILAKLNPKSIYLFDGDHVESVNLAGQLYSIDDIGLAKTTALARTISKYAGYNSIVSLERNYLLSEEIVGDIMICGFDSMYAREIYFNAWKNRVDTLSSEDRKNCLFIDGRLTADEFQIFCMTGEDNYYMQEYKDKYLFRDYQARDLPCSFKQTGYLAQMIGSFMVNLFVNFCANQVNPARQMTLPFLTSYRGDMMYLDLRR